MSGADLIAEKAPFARPQDLADLVSLRRSLAARNSGSVDVVTEAGLSPYLRDRILAEARPIDA